MIWPSVPADTIFTGVAIELKKSRLWVKRWTACSKRSCFIAGIGRDQGSGQCAPPIVTAGSTKENRPHFTARSNRFADAGFETQVIASDKSSTKHRNLKNMLDSRKCGGNGLLAVRFHCATKNVSNGALHVHNKLQYILCDR